MPSFYPAMINLQGTKCLVVGGGHIAFRKASELCDFGADVRIITKELYFIPGELKAEIIVKDFEFTDLNWASMVFCCTNDRLLNQQIYNACKEKNLLINCADDPGNCSFIVPAVVREGNVVIAVSSSGKSPAFSSFLRDRIAEFVEKEVPDANKIVESLSLIRHMLAGRNIATESFNWRPVIEYLLDPDCAEKDSEYLIERFFVS